MRALSLLPHIDYADGFLVDARRAGRRSGEEWARETLEGAPAATRASLRRGWWMLGLKVPPAGGENVVLAWHLRRSGEDFALLGLDSRLGMPAELLLCPQGDELFFGTFIQHRNPAMRALWKTIEGPHQRIVPRLLAGAERRLAEPFPADGAA